MLPLLKNFRKEKAEDLAKEIISKLNDGKSFDDVKEEYKDFGFEYKTLDVKNVEKENIDEVMSAKGRFLNISR